MRSRNRFVSFALATLVCLAAMPARAADEPATSGDLGETPHAFVMILQGRLKPDVQNLKAGEALGWLNYSDKIARVVFDKEVAKKMICKKEGSFRLNGDRLESNPIQASQFATLCVLSKGEYDYKVELFAGAGGGAPGVPSSTKKGKIVVE